MTAANESAGALLIVDDNRDAADLLGDVLVAMGYEVRVAHTARAALDLLTDFTPDCALLDIGLPVIDGYQLAGLLQHNVPGIRLVAVTAYGSDTDRDRARDAGFAAHLLKPVAVETILDTLDALLTR